MQSEKASLFTAYETCSANDALPAAFDCEFGVIDNADSAIGKAYTNVLYVLPVSFSLSPYFHSTGLKHSGHPHVAKYSSRACSRIFLLASVNF
jgi:hypothetical protein